MDQMFDPTVDQSQIAQLLNQVAALRKQQYVQPQGQMVSGHFVAPSAGQQLAPLVNGIVADTVENRATQKQADLNARSQADMAAWLRRRPVSVGDQEPSDSDLDAWASQGLRNPLTKDVASKALTDSVVNAPIRAEKRADRLLQTKLMNERYDADREARNNNLLLTLQSRQDLLTQRLASEQQNSQLAASIRQQIADGQRAMQQIIEDGRNRRAAAALDQKSSAADDKLNNPKPLSSTQQKQVADLAGAVGQYQDLYNRIKPEYFGAGPAAKFAAMPLGGIAEGLGMKIPQSDKDMADWHQQFKALDNPERHALFGSALTKTENASYKQTTISPTSTYDQAKTLIARRMALEKLAIDRIQKIGQGWTFNSETGELTPPAKKTPGQTLLRQNVQVAAPTGSLGPDQWVGSPDDIEADIAGSRGSPSEKSAARASYARWAAQQGPKGDGGAPKTVSWGDLQK